MLGKRVADDLYLHVASLRTWNDERRAMVEAALEQLASPRQGEPNVVKFNLRTGRFSLLAYPSFEEDPFPALTASWTFTPGEGSPSYRSYEDVLNPPILHRKELLVTKDHPRREEWSQLTSTAEGLGFFDDSAIIGFRQNWLRTIEHRGYRLEGDTFVPVGNDLQGESATSFQASAGAIQRHLTALSRTTLSAPVQLLLRNGLLSQGETLFDYGCGRGGDVAALCAHGFSATGWDPHYAPDNSRNPADVVNLGFVINVIEDPVERVEALTRAFELTRRVMAVAVMLHGSDPAGIRFRDGFLTSRNTFQKYFSQGEFKDFVEQVLNQQAFMAGPGVAFVFADRDAEQRYSSSRFRSREVASRLLELARVRTVSPSARRERALRVPRPDPKEVLLDRARTTLDQLWSISLDLGRYPEPEEVGDLASVNEQVGTLSKAIRLLERHYNPQLLAEARQTRADDLRLFFATQHFSKRQAYRQLEPRLQRDVKAFFGDYRSAQAAGLELLSEAARPEFLLPACQRAASEGLGWLEGEQHSLQLHFSLVECLPVILRAYVACGLLLWDAVSEVQLIKIHIGSGKLTLLEFENFDDTPLPLLRRRIKVNVRALDYDLFEYGSAEYPKAVLYWKSRYLNEDYPGYAEQLAFDQALDEAGILTGSSYGPPLSSLEMILEQRRLAVRGNRLIRSDRIPDLDQACGRFLTYRSLIECGETQHKLSIANIPQSPASFNALHALAVNVLDPVIEYFGSIRLTYGFCSAALGRHIKQRVAPKLDQHAACENNSRSQLICARGGASCDFIVEDEDMEEVAGWIIENTPFDRLYFYGCDRPVHVSYASSCAGLAYRMVKSSTGRQVPRPWKA